MGGMGMDLFEACDVVTEFSKALGIKSPDLIVSRKIAGRNGYYNALSHRIVVGQELMFDARTAIRVVLAHEMGHVTQRWTNLRDIFVFAGVIVGLGAAVISAVLHETQNGRVPIPTTVTLFGVLFASAAFMERWLARQALSREFEADAIAVDLCGHDSVLEVLRHQMDGSKQIAKRVARMESTHTPAAA